MARTLFIAELDTSVRSTSIYNSNQSTENGITVNSRHRVQVPVGAIHEEKYYEPLDRPGPKGAMMVHIT